MKRFFEGRKRIVTIPLAVILGLFFLPLTLLLGLGLLINSKIKNKIIRVVGFTVVGIFTLLFGASYVVAFVSPSPKTEVPVVVEATKIPEVQGVQTEVNMPTPEVTSTDTPTMTPTITAKPTMVSQTPKSTIKPMIQQPTTKPVEPSNNSTGGGYACNCSKTCPNMNSCAEAQYQLNVCGCSARDSDDDGIACDAQCQ